MSKSTMTGDKNVFSNFLFSLKLCVFPSTAHGAETLGSEKYFSFTKHRHIIWTKAFENKPKMYLVKGTYPVVVSVKQFFFLF